MGISKLVAIAGLAALPTMGSALSISGTLAGLEGMTPNTPGSALLVEPVALSGTPFDFQAGFLNSDAAGTFQFDFFNDSKSTMMIAVADFTILQDSVSKFAGGVTTSFGSKSETTAAGALASFALTARVAAGDMISLVIDYGDPMGATGAGGPVGPDIDFLITAPPVPVPAAAVLLAGALGGLGFAARRKQKNA